MRKVDFGRLTKGVLHSKFWIVDRKHVFIGSANMDWRALTQVKSFIITALVIIVFASVHALFVVSEINEWTNRSLLFAGEGTWSGGLQLLQTGG